MCHHNMGAPHVGSSGSASHTQHLVHVNNVLYWGQAHPHAHLCVGLWLFLCCYFLIKLQA